MAELDRYDDNLTANPKRAKELMRAMIDRKFSFNRSAQVRTDGAKDPKTLDLMRAVGRDSNLVCHPANFARLFDSVGSAIARANLASF